MVFFPLVNILNVSIILMMIIVFFNYSSAEKSEKVPIQIKLFQLVIRDDTNYSVYLARKSRPEEKKMTIHEFYLSKHNLEARRIPIPTDKSIDDQIKRKIRYCKRIPKISYNLYIHDFDVYYDPDYATMNHIKIAFEKLTCTLFTCLKSVDEFFKPLTQNEAVEWEIQSETHKSNNSDEEDEDLELLKGQFKEQLKEQKEENTNIFHTLFEGVPKTIKVFLKNALKNENEKDAVKTKCCNLKFWRRFKNQDALYAEEVITKIGKIFENYGDKGVEKERTFYMCMMNFKNGVTELNRNIGKYTPERMSKKDYSKLDIKYKKIYDREIIKLDDYDKLSSENKKRYKMSQANKKKILEIDEINYLEKIGDENYAPATISYWKSVFTGDYKATESEKKNTETACIDGIQLMDKLNFKVTKLSYLIYPNKNENCMNRYKEKKRIIIKNLKLLDKFSNKNNESGKIGTNNHIYQNYEKENFKMNETTFKQLKLCRAIPGEVYETYVLRLNNNDCVPLYKQMWEFEVIDMESIDITNLSEFNEFTIVI